MVPCGDREDKVLKSSGKFRLEMAKLAVKEYF